MTKWAGDLTNTNFDFFMYKMSYTCLVTSTNILGRHDGQERMVYFKMSLTEYFKYSNPLSP